MLYYVLLFANPCEIKWGFRAIKRTPEGRRKAQCYSVQRMGCRAQCWVRHSCASARTRPPRAQSKPAAHKCSTQTRCTRTTVNSYLDPSNDNSSASLQFARASHLWALALNFWRRMYSRTVSCVQVWFWFSSSSVLRFSTLSSRSFSARGTARGASARGIGWASVDNFANDIATLRLLFVNSNKWTIKRDVQPGVFLRIITSPIFAQLTLFYKYWHTNTADAVFVCQLRRWEKPEFNVQLRTHLHKALDSRRLRRLPSEAQQLQQSALVGEFLLVGLMGSVN